MSCVENGIEVRVDLEQTKKHKKPDFFGGQALPRWYFFCQRCAEVCGIPRSAPSSSSLFRILSLDMQTSGVVCKYTMASISSPLLLLVMKE